LRHLPDFTVSFQCLLLLKLVKLAGRFTDLNSRTQNVCLQNTEYDLLQFLNDIAAKNSLD